MNIDGIRRVQKNNLPALSETSVVSVASAITSPSRRSFLKYMMLGSGVLVIGKLFGPSLNLFAGAGEKNGVSSFKNFRVVEKGKEMQLFDQSGHEILSFDKTA